MFNFGYNSNANSNQGNTAASTFGAKPAGGGFTFGANNANTSGSTGFFSNNANNSLASPQTGTTGGLFGAQNNQRNDVSGGGFFANNNTNRATSGPTGGLFGQSNNQQAGNTGSLFGGDNRPQNPSTLGGGFGNQQVGTGTTGIFGQNNASINNSGTGGLFGQNNTSTNNSGAGGLFGQNMNNSSTTGGLFGQNNIASNTISNTGGLVGQNNASSGTNNNTGSLFGQNNTGSMNTNIGGFFGQNNSGTSGQTGGLFGQNNSGGSSLFGQKPPAANAPSTGGLFGQPSSTLQQPQQQQQQQQNSLFTPTVKTTQPSFAWSQQPTSQLNGLQGQQQTEQKPQQLQQNQQQALLYDPRHLSQQQQQQQQHSNYPQQIQEQIMKCMESWNPNNQRSKLRTFVYNKCNETEAILYSKPANVTQEDWDKALINKPNANVIPIEIKGFEDLNQRHNLQRDHVAQARIILSQILEKLTNVSQKHELDTATRILKAQSRNSNIQNRIMKLATQIAILKSKGLPLSVQEENLVVEFKKLLDSSNDPAGLGKNNELWARLAVLKERAKTLSNQLDSTLVVIAENGGASASTGDANDENQIDGEERRIDEEVVNRVNKIADILMNQQRGLIYLHDVLEKDTQVVDKFLIK
ncbi:HDL037Wp [Eremothecium sinecaudum]|uniref:HDL037Wp n=1 Tax=Eremothecium sinecaudum TaxID=45286 RepID=A0A0X8HSI5_9SACH|nr:HDL037Wp [Eremothecium sinecaudum]AMD20707.1 HDL037Wp [Eremothecium sinecaudum]